MTGRKEHADYYQTYAYATTLNILGMQWCLVLIGGAEDNLSVIMQCRTVDQRPI